MTEGSDKNNSFPVYKNLTPVFDKIENYQDKRNMRPLIWVGVLLSVHIVNAWPPSIIHCANRQSRTDILNCVNGIALRKMDYRYISNCLQGIPHNLGTSLKQDLKKQCVHVLEVSIQKRYYSQQHLTRMSSMFPGSAANAVLMFYHHYHLWFFTLLVGRLTSQAITL